MPEPREHQVPGATAMKRPGLDHLSMRRRAPLWLRACRKRQLNVQAGCQFCDSAFQAEVATGRLSSSSLDTYACVALAGVATEWLRFGRAEGGLEDVRQLDRLLQALRFTQVCGPGRCVCVWHL